ncbi:imidazole glycerol phosphate synthase subunit HisF [Puniceicoccus vermicola]|uniref:imidazole glycerol-phosphate synthase n=1 Tax=Puniceicoccus vermicola TaxID=388746 RepID=A0A7X1E3K3_9BACT|nr:imidazole glycerol phosphate synthase cyclase subunit [Puniceicoccus vermicola]MBC2601069.1 imidazole glycerol phosphate synthase subunit HisF [Puniceicoccus vermicola]
MLKKRIIPVILLRDGKIVQSRRFSRYNILGNPTPAVERISNWMSDELIYIDITDPEDDFAEAADLEVLVQKVAEKCSVPLTFGGGIRDLRSARELLRLGADKITLNTAAFDNPQLIREIATEFGSQCVVVSIDAKPTENGQYEVFKGGHAHTGVSPVEHARAVEKLGAGEILINSIQRDGTGSGFDIDLINRVVNAVSVPVIALGGAGKWEDFAAVLSETDACAVAAANIFQHSENSVHECRKYLFEKEYPVRRHQALSNDNHIL